MNALKNWKGRLMVFVLVNLLVYVGVWLLQDKVNFNNYYYAKSLHVWSSARTIGKPTTWLRMWNVFDGQWYLLGARNMYLKWGQEYGFMPLWAFVCKLLSLMTGGNLELAAMVGANGLFWLGLESCYWVFKKVEGEKVAVKGWIWGLVLPTGIFFRGYFSESMYLLELVWFGYFLWKKKYVWAAVMMAVMGVTRSASWALAILLVWKVWRETRSIRLMVWCGTISVLGVWFWGIWSRIHTGNFLAYFAARTYWPPDGISDWKVNLLLVVAAPILAKYGIITALINWLVFWILVWVTVKSRKTIPPSWWWIVVTSFAFVLVGVSSMKFSFTRYVSVLFPIYLFLAKKTDRRWLGLIMILGILGLVLTGLLVSNWYMG
jgi:hypothetical protein